MEHRDHQPIPVALVGMPRPYQQAIFAALDSNRFTPAMPDDVSGWVARDRPKAVMARIDVSSGQSQLGPLVGSPRTLVVAITEVLSVEAFVHALALGCDGVIHEDTTAEIVVSVLEAAARGEVVLPTEAAQSMARKVAQTATTTTPLTTDEIEILQELSSGTTVVMLAERIGWSERTMRRRVHSICLKLGVTNRSQAIVAAARAGIVNGG